MLCWLFFNKNYAFQLLKIEGQLFDNENEKHEIKSNVESKQENDGINSTQLRRDVSGTPGGDQAGDVAQDGEGRTGRADKDIGSQSGDGEKAGSILSETGLSGGRSEQQPDGNDHKRKDIQPVGEQRKNQRNSVIKEGSNIISRDDVAKINANLVSIRMVTQLHIAGSRPASPGWKG